MPSSSNPVTFRPRLGRTGIPRARWNPDEQDESKVVRTSDYPTDPGFDAESEERYWSAPGRRRSRKKYEEGCGDWIGRIGFLTPEQRADTPDNNPEKWKEKGAEFAAWVETTDQEHREEEEAVKAKARKINFGDKGPHLRAVRDDEPLEVAAQAEAGRALLDRLITARDLGRRTFAPIEWLVSDMLPEGVGIFPGAPKSGKSFIMLDLALALTTGGLAFGAVKVARRPVLYLALEDGERRIKERMVGMGYSPRRMPSNLDLLTDAEPEEVLPLVQQWIDRHPNGLVLIDVLAKATPGTPKRGESEYQFYYRVLGKYKKIAHAHPGCGILIAHHTKKRGAAGGSGDFIDDALGSTALSGAVDYNLTLAFQRGASQGKLMKTGKDGADYTVALDRQNSGAWHLDGDTFEEAQHNVATVTTTGRGAPLRGKSLAVLALVRDNGSTTITEVAEVLNVDRNQAGTYLRRLRDGGRLRQTSDGSYVLVEGAD